MKKGFFNATENKRLISLFMSVLMVFAYLPFSAVISSAESSSTTGGIVTAKNYDPNTGDLTLESYVTGETQVVQSKVPVDVVLVLDTSGSMSYSVTDLVLGDAVYSPSTGTNYAYITSAGLKAQAYYCSDCGGWYTEKHSSGGCGDSHDGTKLTYKTSATDTTSGAVQFYAFTEQSSVKMDILKTSVKNFIASLGDTTTDADATQNRVAIVQFNSNEYKSESNLLTESTSKGYTSLCKNFTYLTDDGTDTDGISTLDGIVDSLSADGATASDYGMTIANKLFSTDNGYDVNNDRMRFVVLFTDGTPTYSNSFSETVANNAIAQAKILKNTYGATVYSAGVFDDETDDIRNYMNAVSSNYPEADSLTSMGTASSLQEYYLLAQDAETISANFNEIATEVGYPHYKLDENTVVHDVITKYFNLNNVPDYTEVDLYKNVSVYKVKCTAVDSDGNPTAWQEKSEWTKLSSSEITVTYDSTTQAVDVSGFNYSADENWVGVHPGGVVGGYKLVIQIPIKLKDGYSGNLATNETGSGLIPNGKTESIQDYPVPKIDIPVSVKFNAVKGSNAVNTSATFDVTYQKVKTDDDGVVYTETVTDDGASWFKAQTESATVSKSIKYNSSDTVDNIYDGSTITLTLPADYTISYNTSIQPTGKTYTSNTDGTYTVTDSPVEGICTVTVEPDMIITVTDNSTVANGYTVTYSYNGQTATETVTSGNTPANVPSKTTLNNAAPANKCFKSWSPSNPGETTITGATTFTANYADDLNNNDVPDDEDTYYTVTYSYNGNTSDENVLTGMKPANVPSKTTLNNAAPANKCFKSWSPSKPGDDTITSAKTYTAVYADDLNNNDVPDDEDTYYTVTYSYNGNTSDENVLTGMKPANVPSKTTLNNAAPANKCFKSWSPSKPSETTITGATTFTANYADDLNNNDVPDDEDTYYTVTYSYNGNTSDENVLTGMKPANVPSKTTLNNAAPANKCFKSWSPSKPGDDTITSAKTYTAVYADDLNNNDIPDDEDTYYTVIYSYNGNTSDENVLTGMKPANVPSKTTLNNAAPANKCFKNWSPSNPNETTITGATTFTANYADDINNNDVPDDEDTYYTVTYSYNGNTSDENVLTGMKPANVPSKTTLNNAAPANKCFKSWSPSKPGDDTITSAKTYTAVYADDLNNNDIPDDEETYYTVTYSYNGNTSDENVLTGMKPANVPSKTTLNDNAPANKCFKSWSPSKPSETTITGATTFTAVYADDINNNDVPDDEETTTYTVTFKDWKGGIIDTDTVNYGGTAVAPTAPVRANCKFNGWNKSLENITEDKVVVALYKSDVEDVTNIDIPEDNLVVVFKDYNGDILGVDAVEKNGSANYPTHPERAYTDSVHYLANGWDTSNENISDDTVIIALYKAETHTYSDKVTVVTPATLTQDGSGTVKCNCGKTKTVVIDALSKYCDIKAENDNVDISETKKLNVTVTNNNKANLKPKFESLNPDIVTVDEDGNITGLKAGTAQIKITLDNGKTKIITITVNEFVSYIELVLAKYTEVGFYDYSIDDGETWERVYPHCVVEVPKGSTVIIKTSNTEEKYCYYVNEEFIEVSDNTLTVTVDSYTLVRASVVNEKEVKSLIDKIVEFFKTLADFFRKLFK